MVCAVSTRLLSCGEGGDGRGVVGGDAVEEPVEAGAGEFPVEGYGGGVVAGLEGQYPFGEGVEVGQVVGCEHLALQDGVEDFDLVQPGRVYGQVHQLGGQVVVIRLIEACPRCEEPLSTTQNIRSALA